MSTGVTAAVIAAVVSVVVAAGSVGLTYLTYLTTRASLRRDPERQHVEFGRTMTGRLYDRRVAAYPELFAATEAFRKLSAEGGPGLVAAPRRGAGASR